MKLFLEGKVLWLCYAMHYFPKSIVAVVEFVEASSKFVDPLFYCIVVYVLVSLLIEYTFRCLLHKMFCCPCWNLLHFFPHISPFVPWLRPEPFILMLWSISVLRLLCPLCSALSALSRCCLGLFVVPLGLSWNLCVY